MGQIERIDLGYIPRDQFVSYHLRKERWAAVVAHRRAGKTVACIMDLIDHALRLPLSDGRFAYLAPTYSQAKDVAWGYLKQYTLAIPGVKQHETELRVDFPRGGRIRLYGSDNYDRLRGIYLDGIVLDEYADMDPRAWSEVIRPLLSDRRGWATFIGTPKGRNAFYRLFGGDKDTGFAGAELDAEWFSLKLKASETHIIPIEELDDARRMMTPEQYAQEYECDFNAALIGAYYGRDIALAEEQKRICSVPHDKNADVFAGWDLGGAGKHSDANAIWIGQVIGQEIHLIDYIENAGQDTGWYVDLLKTKPYTVIEHWLPHDAEAHQKTTRDTVKSYMEGRGLRCRVIPNHAIPDRINSARVAFNRCWFDKTHCEHGIEALRMYQEKRDEKRDVGMGPLHDWASHGADAFGYFIMGTGGVSKVKWEKPRAVKGLV